MKLKREHLASSGNAIPIFEGWVFFLLFLTGVCVKAQTITVTATDPNAAEVVAPATPNPGTFTISRNPNTFSNATVTYSVTGNAKPGEDYTALSGSVLLTVLNPSATITVDVLDDDIVENNESVTVTLTSSTQGTVDTTPATVTIADVTDVGTFSLDLTEPPFMPNASEEGPTNGNFRIILDNANGTATPVTVNYNLTGTAVNGEDYSVSGTVNMTTFANNDTEVVRDVNIIPIDDAILEEAETVTLTLVGTNNPGKFRIGTPDTAEITIADNDCAAGATPPAINGNTTEFCNPPDANVNLNDFVTGGAGSAPANAALRWSTNANPTAAGDLLPNATATASNTYYAVYVADDDSCYSPVSEAVEVTINTAPSAGTVSTPVAACSNNTNEFGPNRIDLDDLIEGEDDGDWEQTGGPDLGNLPNNNNIDFRGQTAGNYEFTYTTDTAVAPCTNTTSVITISVSDCDPCEAGNLAPVLDTDVSRTFCDDIDVSLNDYAPNTGPNGTVLRWATDDDDPINNFVPNNRIDDPLPGTYFGFYYDSTNDCASPLLTLSLTENPTPEITESTENSRCGPGTLQLRALANLDATIRWYARATGGAVLQSGANFTTPNIAQTTSYFVEATANGCISPRTEVVATVIPQPSAGAPENTSSCNDAEFGNTILDLDNTFSGTADEGAWSFTSGPSAITLNTENQVDFQGSANGDYVFTYTTTGAEAPCENEAAEVTISVSSCDTDDDGDGLLGGLESMLGTDPNNVDTDGDGINDDVEVGTDTDNPLDEDEDGIIDALDSNTEDADQDGVNDQQDPANENACIPDRFNGQCDTDGDGVSDLEEQTNGSDPDDACDPNATPNCADPIDLEVLKEVDIPDAIVGDQVVFTVTVNNLSDRKAISVVIGDMLETGFQIDSTASVTASSGEYDVATGMWTIPEIAAMGTETLTLPVLVIEGGPYENTAELLASVPEDDNPDNDSATVTLNIDLPEGIDLVLEKFGRIVNDSLETRDNENGKYVGPLVGENVIFTIRVTNDSQEAAVSNIQVLDTISASDQGGFVYVSHNVAGDRGEYNPETGLWVIPELLRGEVAILEIEVSLLLDEESDTGNFSNTASIVRSSPIDSENNYESNTDVVEVKISRRTQTEIGIIFNQFSPNNDGTNDNLKINKRMNRDDVEEVDLVYDIKIFNRYGSLMFEGDQLSDEVIWDGTRDGKNVPDGTYFYVLNVRLQEEVEGVDTNSTEKGWIQLIR